MPRSARQEPEGDKPKKFTKAVVEIPSSGFDSDSNVIGQEASVRLLEGAFYRHLLLAQNGHSENKSVVLVGPSGCGKATAVAEVATKFNVPLATVDFREGEPIANSLRIAVQSFRQTVGDCPERMEQGVVLVRGVKSAEHVTQILASLPNVDRISYGHEGNKFVVDITKCLFVVSVTANEEQLSKAMDVIHVQSGRFVSQLIPLEPLSRQDLFAILTVSTYSPLQGLRSRLAAASIHDFQITDMRAMELVSSALSNHPDLGAHALTIELNQLEGEIWAQISQKALTKTHGTQTLHP